MCVGTLGPSTSKPSDGPLPATAPAVAARPESHFFASNDSVRVFLLREGGGVELPTFGVSKGPGHPAS